MREFTISQLVEAAERDVLSRSVAPAIEKTAAAPRPESIDLLSTEAIMALAKIGHDLAQRLKMAEDSMEGGSNVNTGPVEAGKENSAVPSAETPEQFVVAPTGEVDLSPPKSSLSIPESTEQKPDDSAVSGISAPAQFLAPKVGAIDPIRAMHENYLAAATLLSKSAQPGGIAQVVTETGPGVGPGKPEAYSTEVGDIDVPSTYNEVASTTRQDTADKAISEAAEETGLPAEAAKSTMEGDLKEVLDAATSENPVKAAAFRQWYKSLDPNSKVACLIRDRLAAIARGGSVKMGEEGVKVPVSGGVKTEDGGAYQPTWVSPEELAAQTPAPAAPTLPTFWFPRGVGALGVGEGNLAGPPVDLTRRTSTPDAAGSSDPGLRNFNESLGGGR